jgi:hypothetical protein
MAAENEEDLDEAIGSEVTELLLARLDGRAGTAAAGISMAFGLVDMTRPYSSNC